MKLALVAFTTAPTARGIFQVPFTANVLGTTSDPPVAVTTGSFPGADYQPDWRDTLAIAVTAPTPLDLAWAADGGPEYLAQGTPRSMGVQLARRAEASGPVRLSLISSQRPPMKEVDKRQVVDESRALRLASAVVVPPDQQRADIVLLTPRDLPLHPWSFAIKAELLAADEQQVLATTLYAHPPLACYRTIASAAGRWSSPLTVKAGDDDGLVLRGRLATTSRLRLSGPDPCRGTGRRRPAADGDAGRRRK